MYKKTFKSLLIVAAVITSSAFADRKNKEFCTVVIQKCLKVHGNETVDGNLRVEGNLRVDGLTTLNGGVTVATGALTVGGLPFPSAVQSIVPFSSGVVTVADLPAGAFLPANGVVMAFGNSSAVNGTTAVAFTQSAFAFDVPHAGRLANLQVSVDPMYLVSVAGTAFPFTFTVIRSSCVNGVVTAYSATPLTATATITSPGTGALTQGPAGCGASAAGVSIPVAQGDRITILITSTAGAAIIPATIPNLAFSAGIMYFPA